MGEARIRTDFSCKVLMISSKGIMGQEGKEKRKEGKKKEKKGKRKEKGRKRGREGERKNGH